MAREYFLAYHSYLESMKELTDAEKGRLFTACLVYSKTGEAPELCGNERYLFPAIQSDIDRDNAKYAKRCATNKRNGGMRGKQTLAIASDRYRTLPNASDCFLKKEKEDTPLPSSSSPLSSPLSLPPNPYPLPPYNPPYNPNHLPVPEKEKNTAQSAGAKDAFRAFAGDDLDLLSALQEFEKMRKSIKKPMTDRAKQLLVKKLSSMTCDVREQIAILEQSTLNCWQGLFPLKQEPPAKARNSGDNVFMEIAKELEGGIPF